MQPRRQAAVRQVGGNTGPASSPKGIRHRTLSPSQARSGGIQSGFVQQQRANASSSSSRAYSQPPKQLKPKSSPRVQPRHVIAAAEEDEASAASDRVNGPQAQPMALPCSWKQDFEDCFEDHLLGGGAFANIYKVVERSSRQEYAMKVMYRPNFTMRGIDYQVQAEVEAMQRLTSLECCRHVARLFDAIEENDYVYLRMELCITDLLRYTNNLPTARLPERDATTWLRQCLLGLRDLHGVGILHRDIKPENLLLTPDWCLKIADFGWCADLRDAPSSLAGTFLYMAPEMLGGLGVQTEAVDVWSAAVTFFQLMLGRTLLTTYLGPGATQLSATDPHAATKVKTGWLLVEIQERCPPAEEERPSYISWCCWDLFMKLLVPEVSERISVSDALGHQILREVSQYEVSLADDPPPFTPPGVGLFDQIPIDLLVTNSPKLQVPEKTIFAEELHVRVPLARAPASAVVLSPHPKSRLTRTENTSRPLQVAAAQEARSVSPRRETHPRLVCASPDLRPRELFLEESSPRRRAATVTRVAPAVIRSRTADVRMPAPDVVVHTADSHSEAWKASPGRRLPASRVREQSPLEATMGRSCTTPQPQRQESGSLRLTSIQRMSTPNYSARRVSSGSSQAVNSGSINLNGGSMNLNAGSMNLNAGSMNLNGGSMNLSGESLLKNVHVGSTAPLSNGGSMLMTPSSPLQSARIIHAPPQAPASPLLPSSVRIQPSSQEKIATIVSRRDMSPTPMGGPGPDSVLASPYLSSRELNLEARSRGDTGAKKVVVRQMPVTMKAPAVKVDFSKQSAPTLGALPRQTSPVGQPAGSSSPLKGGRAAVNRGIATPAAMTPRKLSARAPASPLVTTRTITSSAPGTPNLISSGYRSTQREYRPSVGTSFYVG